jgi:PncC family amidohydrolase
MSQDRIEENVGEMLQAQNLNLSVAESCTGGLIGHRLTNIAGSSSYFQGGAIVYSYEAKERLLGVKHETLESCGAVSRETAVEMARGARDLFQTDVSLAVTGIAGPGGGMPDKPVGLVYIALDAPDRKECRRFVWEGNREENKQHSAQAALEMLRSYLKDRK